jgi:GDPmannose 4,6-dehydratase
LGNLDSERDWGFAGEYVDAMYRMLQQPEPNDFVIATGETHGIRELLELAFAHLDLDWKTHVVSDPHFLRPADVDSLVGDASRARKDLNWAAKTDFKQLVTMMVDADLALQKRASTSSSLTF